MAEVLRDPPDRRRVAPTVVVQDDHHLGLQLADVVERFIRHAAGERAVADDNDHLAGITAQLARGGEAECVAEPGGRVRVLDQIVLGLASRGIPAQPTLLAERVEPADPAGQHLVDVCLVAGVEDDRVARAVEHPMHRHRELDDAEVGAEVTPRPRDGGDQLLTNLCAEAGQILRAEPAQVVRPGDLLEQHRVSLVEPTRMAPSAKCPYTSVAEHDYRPCRDWSHARRCSNAPREMAISPRAPSGSLPTIARAWSRSAGSSASTSWPASCARAAVCTGAARPMLRSSARCCATVFAFAAPEAAIDAPTTSTPCWDGGWASRSRARPSGSRWAPGLRFPWKA